MINLKGQELIKAEEDLRLKAYQCAAGVWSVGFGHTSDSFYKVKPGATITKEFAEELFLHDLSEAEDTVKAQFPDWELLNENQYAAIVSFVFNTGSLKFLNKKKKRFEDRTILIWLKKHEWSKVADSFLLYTKDIHGKQLAGLVKRRKNERALFLEPPSITIPEPLPAMAMTSWWSRLISFFKA